MKYTLEITEDTVDLLEEDGGLCFCLCCFDLSVDITGLTPGTYLVRVWGYDYEQSEFVLFGQVWVSVGGFGGVPAITKITWGECYGEDFACGDCNGDGRITGADAIYLVSYIYRGGPAPIGQGDVNLDGRITSADAVYIVTFIYRGGPPPGNPPLGTTPIRDEKRIPR